MNIYGVRGYPTPDYTDERHCRTFSIPNTTIALAVFMGALWTLAEEANWQAYGDMTPAEAAEAFQNVIWEAYDTDEGICPVIEAPYWDTYDNADDQDPEGAPETWYGELVPVASFRAESLLDDELTWRENIAIWATAGFIAYSGQIGAAIAFVPFARRFVLKFRGNPLGAIAEIFLDGERLATLDTASAEDRIKAIDIILPDDEDDHELWVAVGEESPDGSVLQVVRKELDQAEVYPNSLRYNSDTDTVQYSPDGGETWVDDPDDDPRTGTKFIKPPKTGIDVRCRSAASMVQWIRQFIDYEAGVLTTGANIIAVANAALALFDIIAPFAILATLIIDFAGTLFGIGGTALEGAFDEETYDILLCIFFCNMSNAGVITDDQFAEIQNQIGLQVNTTANIVLQLILGVQGRVGLQNAGTLYEVEDANCSDCGCAWCHEWTGTDLTTVWSGSGAHISIDMFLSLDAGFNLTHFEADYVMSVAGLGGDSSLAFGLNDTYGEKVVFISPITTSTGTFTWDGNNTTGLHPSIWGNTNNTGGTTVEITRILMRGCGESPYDINCDPPETCS